MGRGDFLDGDGVLITIGLMTPNDTTMKRVSIVATPLAGHGREMLAPLALVSRWLARSDFTESAEIP